MEQEYETDYAGDGSFPGKKAKNDAVIRDFVIPQILTAGMNCFPFVIDSGEYRLSEAERKNWIDPVPRYKGIRPPDLLSVGNKDFNIQGSDSKSIYFEFKDQSQENCFWTSGIEFYHARTYVTWQHQTETPVAMVFRDLLKQEAGKPPYLPAYKSAFKENDQNVLYGGLLMDMMVIRSRCFTAQKNKERAIDLEVRWRAQQDETGDLPVMHSIKQLGELLRSGQIKKVRGDPKELLLWNVLQDYAEKIGVPKLIEPPGGLIYFKR